MNTPYVGQTVHYIDGGLDVEDGARLTAAIITHVFEEEGLVNLTVFHNTFVEHAIQVRRDDAGAPFTWRPVV